MLNKLNTSLHYCISLVILLYNWYAKNMRNKRKVVNMGIDISVLHVR